MLSEAMSVFLREIKAVTLGTAFTTYEAMDDNDVWSVIAWTTDDQDNKPADLVKILTDFDAEIRQAVEAHGDSCPVALLVA